MNTNVAESSVLPDVNDQKVEIINPDNNILKSPPRLLKDHPIDNIIGDINTKVATRRQLTQMGHVAFISDFEPKNFKEAAKDDFLDISNARRAKSI